MKILRTIAQLVSVTALAVFAITEHGEQVRWKQGAKDALAAAKKWKADYEACARKAESPTITNTTLSVVEDGFRIVSDGTLFRVQQWFTSEWMNDMPGREYTTKRDAEKRISDIKVQNKEFEERHERYKLFSPVKR